MKETQLSLKLRKLRTEKGLTQRYIADILGIERSTYAKYENAQAVPPFHTAVKLAEIFGVSIAYLSGEKISDSPDNFSSGIDNSSDVQEFINRYCSLNEADRALLRDLVFKLSGNKPDGQ